MYADLKGTLERINKSYRMFTHNGVNMTKEQVKKVLLYGIKKGYKSTSEISDKEVDQILNN